MQGQTSHVRADALEHFILQFVKRRWWPFAARSVSWPDDLHRHVANMQIPKAHVFLCPKFVGAGPEAVQNNHTGNP